MKIKSTTYKLHDEVAFGAGYTRSDKTVWWTFLFWAGWINVK